jgi:hypothetical protein
VWMLSEILERNFSNVKPASGASCRKWSHSTLTDFSLQRQTFKMSHRQIFWPSFFLCKITLQKCFGRLDCLKAA